MCQHHEGPSARLIESPGPRRKLGECATRTQNLLNPSEYYEGDESSKEE
jgi:hypothetical protein